MNKRNDDSTRRGLWRSRWAAVGAAVAVTLGGGGLWVAQAAPGPASNVITVDPVRIMDSRDGNDIGVAGPFVSAIGLDLQVTGMIPTDSGDQIVVPDGATGVMLNVTVVSPQAAGFVSVRPADALGAPTTSNLNFTAGAIVPNAVIVQLPTAGPDAGKIEITYNAFDVPGPETDILVDVVAFMQEDIGSPTGHIYATVAADGTLITDRSSGAASVNKSGTGTYTVVFSSNISACIFLATPSDLNQAPETKQVAIQGTPVGTTGVFVQTADNNDALTDSGFFLGIFC